MQFVKGEESAPPLSIDDMARVWKQHSLCTEFVVPWTKEFWISTKGPAPTQKRPQDESPLIPMPVDVIRLHKQSKDGGDEAGLEADPDDPVEQRRQHRHRGDHPVASRSRTGLERLHL